MNRLAGMTLVVGALASAGAFAQDAVPSGQGALQTRIEARDRAMAPGDVVGRIGFAQDAVPSDQGAVRAQIEARGYAMLSSEIAGRIGRIAVEPGQSFSHGDVLLRFACERYQAELDAAKAAAKAAEVTVRQSNRLAQLQSIGAAEVELAAAKADGARAAVRKAEADVRACEIKAPFDGRLIEQKVHENETVAPGAPLLEILSDRDLRIVLMVPSSWAVWLKTGETFDLRIDETGERLKGEITFIGAKVDPVSQSLKAAGKLLPEKGTPPPHLIAGMSGTASFAPPGEAMSAR
jgi:RND family efflux transporter MFP subunit